MFIILDMRIRIYNKWDRVFPGHGKRGNKGKVREFCQGFQEKNGKRQGFSVRSTLNKYQA